MNDSKNNNFKIPFSITLVLSISFLFLIPHGFSITHILAISHSNNAITNPTPNHSNGKTVGPMNTTSENSKVVILTFGDTVKSQFTTAKPILDQYGYKASFFITCNYVGQTQRMNWNDIACSTIDIDSVLFLL
jgi:peptidoglycan/xylan/chitin deacetylase (PgdA/CDA1 family)